MSRPLSPTRLLLLGAVHIFQPVHGYFVRRELLSWRADEWAHLNPGSIYGGLATLTREGFLEEAGTAAHDGRPARTSYRLTADGESELMTLLRSALWTVTPHAPANLLAAWSFAPMLGRDEVVAALEHRLEQIAAAGLTSGFAAEEVGRARGKPAHVAEHFRLGQSRLDGEAAWTRDLLERLRAGKYWFDGEPDPPWPSMEGVAGRAQAPPAANRSHAGRRGARPGSRT